MREIIYYNNVYINHSASTVGKKEYNGPLGKFFDALEEDEYFGCKSFEEAESEMVRRNLNILIGKSGLDFKDVDLIVGGDLINQCTATSFAIAGTNIPYLGLYGACSTAIESIICASTFINAGYAERAIGLASSHFCSAERQYRFPLEYGSTRTPTSQNTVTGTGAYLISNKKSNIKVKSALIGKIIDKGITDANNMGAAMAGAVVDTIKRYFNNTNEKISDYDLIISGDLGFEGHAIVTKLLKDDNIDLDNKFTDCGMLIYDREKQDVHCGGSGCGCIASVLSAYFLKQLEEGTVKNILTIGTGALLNQNSVFQNRSIPSIAHAVHLSTEDFT